MKDLAEILQYTRDALYSHGKLLLRMEYDQFQQVCDALIDTPLLNNHNQKRSRHPYDVNAQSATKGTRRLGLHREMGYAPIAPKYLAFYCEKPAAQGGESLLCNGLEMWTKMKEGLREKFRGENVRYVAPNLKKTELPSVNQQNSELVLSSLGVKFTYNPDGTLNFEYHTSAIRQTNHGESFCNSILDRTLGSLPGGQITFASEEPLPKEEIELVAEECTEKLLLQSGEALFLDNDLYMHDRNVFEGERILYLRMGK